MKVYSPPVEVGPVPELDTNDIKGWFRKEKEWVRKVVDWCIEHGDGPNKGKEVQFPVADGAARYIVYKPNALIHLPVGDAWQFQYVKRLTAKDIAQRALAFERLDSLFGKKE